MYHDVPRNSQQYRQSAWCISPEFVVSGLLHGVPKEVLQFWRVILKLGEDRLDKTMLQSKILTSDKKPNLTCTANIFVQDCFISCQETFTRWGDDAGNVHVCGSGAKVRSRFLVSETIILVLHSAGCEWTSFITRWGLKVPVYCILKHQLANAPT